MQSEDTGLCSHSLEAGKLGADTFTLSTCFLTYKQNKRKQHSHERLDADSAYEGDVNDDTQISTFKPQEKWECHFLDWEH